jgi:hypothetical protein
MPDTLITDLTSGNPAQSGDELVINRGGADRKVTAGSIAALASGGLPLQLPIRDGRYYAPLTMRITDSPTTTDTFNGLIVAVPFIASEAKTWNRIGINCVDGSAGIGVRIGIYSSAANGLPDALLVDSGELDFSSSGNKEATISQALSANTLYWLALVAESSAVATFLNFSTGADEALLFYGASDGSGASASEVRGTQAYGALPATFPAATITDSSTPPYIWLRTGV